MARNVKHMSQAELADKTGLSRQAIDAIENNRSSPSVYTALAIVQVLEMPVEDIFKLHKK
jgi:putative transcriptional regulator